MKITNTKLSFFIPVLCFLFSCLIGIKKSKTIYVPQDFPSLEKAVQYADSGDKILVHAGEYQISPEGVRILKDITILSALGADKTILVGRGDQPVIYFNDNCRAILQGFTITSVKSNPSATWSLKGGGIYCAPSSAPLVINNIIKGNKAQFGGGIYCGLSSSPHIVQNIIANNEAKISGGGLFSFRAFPQISKNRFIQNRADNSGGGIFCDADEAIINNNLIIENQAIHSGGGCSYIEANTILVNNTISRNIATFGGGIFGLGGESQLINTILWKNQDDLCLTGIKMTARPRFSNISDGDYLGINGNISQNPFFIDPNHGDYRLRPDSPCHNFGDSQTIYNNQDGSRNTMGAYGGPDAII